MADDIIINNAVAVIIDAVAGRVCARRTRRAGVYYRTTNALGFARCRAGSNAAAGFRDCIITIGYTIAVLIYAVAIGIITIRIYRCIAVIAVTAVDYVASRRTCAGIRGHSRITVGVSIRS